MSSRAPIGLLSIAAVDLCTNQGFKSFVPKETDDNLYLYYYLKEHMAQIEAMGWTALVQPTNLLPLPGGGTYTPDFVAWDERPDAEKVLYIIEVKGGYRGAGWEQGYERYRRAAQFYNGRAGIFKFLLMEWDTKDKAWTYQWW